MTQGSDHCLHPIQRQQKRNHLQQTVGLSNAGGNSPEQQVTLQRWIMTTTASLTVLINNLQNSNATQQT